VLLYSRATSVPEGATSAWAIAMFSPPVEPAGVTWLGALRLAIWVNLWLACVNLLPAVPLDGGRLMRGLLWGVLGYRRALRHTQGLMIASAALVCLGPALLRAQGVEVDLFVELPLLMLGVVLFLSAQAEARRRQPPDDAHPQEADEWRVFSPEALLPSDESSGGAALIGQAVEAKLEEKLHRQQRQEEEEDRRMDEILSRLHVAGPAALSPEDQALLKRVSARYRRGRKSK
jgi:hypothetical protein